MAITARGTTKCRLVQLHFELVNAFVSPFLCYEKIVNNPTIKAELE